MSNAKLFDPIRNKFVANLPEEKIRQEWIAFMIEQLGYPKDLIAVEKNLEKMAFLENRRLFAQTRRCDIVVFGSNIHPKHPLYPLLLIECKADKITIDAVEQAKGYNLYLQAYFLAVAAKNEIRTLWYDATKKDYDLVPFLPKYEELLLAVKKK